MKIPIFQQIANISFFFILAVIVDIKWYFIVCIFPMANDVENLSMWLLVICICSLERCIFKSFDHFLTGLSFYSWVIRVLHIFWIQLPYQIYDLQISSIFWVVFLFVDSVHWRIKHFNFDKVQLCFSFIFWCSI